MIDNSGMKFLISVIDDTTGLATDDEMASIDEFNDRLQAEGHWVFACGLTDPGDATVIDNRAGAVKVTKGPLIDSPEHVSGFWIITAPNSDSALELAAEGSRACNRKVELRALH